MNLSQFIANLKSAVAEVKAKVEAGAAETAAAVQEKVALQARVAQLEAGLPVDQVTPTQLADLQAVLADLRSLAA